jgi:aminopeptidase N
LRLAFEEVTGRDLNWFFNEWYFGAGHPNLNIGYSYNKTEKKERVIVTQSDTIFKIPVAIDIYNGPNKVRYQVWVQNPIDTFYFDVTQKPDLINFDGDKVLLCTKKENKDIDEYVHQYKYAATYVDRREAIDFAAKHADDPKAVDLLKTALRDKYEGLRELTVYRLNIENEGLKKAVEPILIDLAKNDPKRTVKAEAIAKLGEYKDPANAAIFKAAVNDSSYTVSGNALSALLEVDPATALNLAKELDKQPSKGELKNAIAGVKASSGDESMAEEILGGFEQMPLSQAKFNAIESVSVYLGALKNTDLVKRGIDDIASFRDAIPEAYKSQTDPEINKVLKNLVIKKNEAGLKEQAEYIKSKLPESEKKGF